MVDSALLQMIANPQVANIPGRFLQGQLGAQLAQQNQLKMQQQQQGLQLGAQKLQAGQRQAQATQAGTQRRDAFFDIVAAFSLTGENRNKLLKQASEKFSDNPSMAEAVLKIAALPDGVQKDKELLAAIEMGVSQGVLPKGERKEAKPTALQSNLMAAGLEPGSPEFHEAVLAAIKRPGTQVDVSVDTSEESFAKEFGKQNAAMFFERRQSAQDAVASLENISEARRLLDSGIILGKGAQFLTGLGSALQTMGINFAEDKVANTEAFAASQAKQVAQIIKAFGAGTGLSDADREFATKAAAGDIGLTEKSVRRIIDINERASMKVIDKFNREATSIEKRRPEISPFPLTIPYSIETQRQETQPQGTSLPGAQPGGQVYNFDVQGNPIP